MAERIKIQPLIWRIFHCAAVEIEAVDIIKVRIGKKQRPQSCDYSLVPCPRRGKGDMVYKVDSIIAFGVNDRARCAAISKLLRQSFAGCAAGRVPHARITGTEVSLPARLLTVTPRSA
jgi:hypothetical protein